MQHQCIRSDYDRESAVLHTATSRQHISVTDRASMKFTTNSCLNGFEEDKRKTSVAALGAIFKNKLMAMRKYIVFLLLAVLLLSCTTPTEKRGDTTQPTVEEGDAIEQLKTALEYDRKGQYEKAAEWYRKAAEQGLSEAQNNLGVMYKDGQGVKKDYQEAVRWFQLAARQGNVLAQSNLGWMYQRGRGVAQDYDSARYWYTQAAQQDHAAAQNNLGVMYRDGLGLLPDTATARYWFEKAALKNLPQAQHNLEQLK